jgi:cytochrome c553
MQRHFDEASAIKDAAIDGDLETMHETAKWVVDSQDPTDYPLAWRPHVVRLVEAAQRVAQAGNVDAAAAATAEVAANCGGCHLAVQARPGFGALAEPADDGSTVGIMDRHQWAADRLWEGIVGPSDEAWTNGVRSFVSAPGCRIDPEEPLSEYMTVLCRQVEGLGVRAASAHAQPERARVYGEFLRTCAACHNAGA